MRFPFSPKRGRCAAKSVFCPRCTASSSTTRAAVLRYHRRYHRLAARALARARDPPNRSSCSHPLRIVAHIFMKTAPVAAPSPHCPTPTRAQFCFAKTRPIAPSTTNLAVVSQGITAARGPAAVLTAAASQEAAARANLLLGAALGSPPTHHTHTRSSRRHIDPAPCRRHS